MFFKIIGDKHKNYDGILTAIFTHDDGKSYTLQFNIDNWIDNITNGHIGGEYIQIVQPEPLQLQFDKDYKFTIETARKIYEILFTNGWRPIGN